MSRALRFILGSFLASIFVGCGGAEPEASSFVPADPVAPTGRPATDRLTRDSPASALQKIPMH